MSSISFHKSSDLLDIEPENAIAEVDDLGKAQIGDGRVFVGADASPP